MEKRYFLIPTIMVTIILVLVLWDLINTGTTNVIRFDEAYNAQVARHFAETGKYAVTYPDEIVFYNPITTGPTILLGTAYCYKIWGISLFTTNIIPTLYGMGVLILLYILSAKILRTKYRYILGIIVVLLYLGLSIWFEFLSTTLIGEIGAIFYALLSTLLISLYFHKGNASYLLFSGFFLAFSLVTKTSQICFSITFIAMVFWDGAIKKGVLKKLLYFLLGFALGIVVWEIFKLAQFNGDVSRLFQWWISEKNNVFNQTGTTSLIGNFTWSKIQDRALYLIEVVSFYGSYWMIILAMVTPVACFIYYYFCRKRTDKETGMGSLIIMALSAESLLVYFVLFGSDGLRYARRLSISGELIVICMLYFFMIWLEKLFQSGYKNIFAWIGSLLLALCMFSQKNSLKDHFHAYILKNCEVSEANRPIQEMKDEIAKLPSNAQIYTYGWWQAPEVGLIVNFKFKNINNNILSAKELEGDENYFLIGDLLSPPEEWDGSCLEWLMQYYELTEIFHSPSRQNEEKYILYKIEDRKEQLEENIQIH